MSRSSHNTTDSEYNEMNSFQNYHIRHPIASPPKWDIGLYLWVQICGLYIYTMFHGFTML